MADDLETGRGPIRIQSILIGEVPSSFAECEREDVGERIDVALAERQHGGYARVVAGEIGRVDRVAAAVSHPDAVFVEDTLVVLDAERAVLTRPGARSRRGEVTAVAAALERRMALEPMRSPATLDGGDVLRVGQVLFVGLSARTNQAGAAMLTAAARDSGIETVRLQVRRGLHLKSACSLLDHETLLYDPGADLDLGPFREIGLACLPAPERLGANVLALGEGRVLVSASAPATAALLSERGCRVISASMTEFHKADGALTCCSIRLPAPGGWCT